jgi:hypothetical protein
VSGRVDPIISLSDDPLPGDLALPPGAEIQAGDGRVLSVVRWCGVLTAREPVRFEAIVEILRPNGDAVLAEEERPSCDLRCPDAYLPIDDGRVLVVEQWGPAPDKGIFARVRFGGIVCRVKNETPES